MEILLSPRYFSQKEKTFVEFGELSGSLFKYETGIDAIRLKNKSGYVILLPYNGQMIWDVVFCGRSLKMKSTYNEPRNVSNFIDTYGCFLMHCGALRMGCPGRDDDHPLHGELPYARYDEVKIIAGNDTKGNYIGVTGAFTYNRAFGDYYIARPIAKLYEDSTLIDISMTIENLSNYPMELMYMCHINFRPVDYGRIVQTASWSSDYMKVRTNIPSHYKIPPEYERFLKQLEDNPRITEIIRPDDAYYPEVIFYLNSVRVDNEGWAQLMQIHPDMTADYLKYKPIELDHCIRWISKTLNQEGLGLALPATCDPEGYNVEKKKGNIKEIAPKGLFTTSLTTGYLDNHSAIKQEEVINKLIM